MTPQEELVREVARGIWDAPDSGSGDPIGVALHMSDHLFPQGGETELDAAKVLCEDIAKAAIAIVLEKVERHLSAVQYDPAPYTALKHRLRALAEEQT